MFIQMLCEFGGMATVPKGTFVFIVSLYKKLYVCPMYAFLQSGQVSL